jgi:hypothetical protein
MTCEIELKYVRSSMKLCKILDLKNDAQFFKYFSAKNSKTLANQSFYYGSCKKDQVNRFIFHNSMKDNLLVKNLMQYTCNFLTN